MFSLTQSWWKKLTNAWNDTVGGLRNSLLKMFGSSTMQSLSQDEEYHLKSLLLAADLGPKIVEQIIQLIKTQPQLTAEEKVGVIEKYLFNKLPPSAQAINAEVIFLVGVNGAGKTTTAAKLAQYIRAHTQQSPYFIPADTYRAGAVDQLVTWANRLNIDYFDSSLTDPGAVIYQGLDLVKADKSILPIIDTSGRLQTQKNLMSELAKLKNIVLKKVPLEKVRVILILDGSQGQNMIQQVRMFHDALGLSSLIITKMDGSSRAGVLCQIYDEFHIPVDFIGVGEKDSDLIPYSQESFAKALLGGGRS